jgi:hypothetical protein
VFGLYLSLEGFSDVDISRIEGKGFLSLPNLSYFRVEYSAGNSEASPPLLRRLEDNGSLIPFRSLVGVV